MPLVLVVVWLFIPLDHSRSSSVLLIVFITSFDLYRCYLRW